MIVMALLLATTTVETDDPPREPTTVLSTPAPAVPPPPTEPGDIVVTAGSPPPKADPLQAVNAVSFKAVQAADTAVIGPVAHAYETAVPKPVRSGVRNILGNLHEPENFLNFLLQHKIGKAAETLGRFAINSTIGVAGLFDVAKRRPFNLPVRYNGFGNTLGFYGVKPGPFLFLPLVGATTVRDLLGYSVDKLILPVGIGSPFNRSTYSIPTGALSALDHRNATDPEIRRIRQSNISPYRALREAYLKLRQAEIDALHTRPPKVEPTHP